MLSQAIYQRISNLVKFNCLKIIHSGEFLGNMIGYLGKKALRDLAVLLAKDLLLILAIKAASYVIYKFERKISEQGAVRKGFTLFISNEDMDDVIKIVELLENPGLLIDAATEIVKHEIKKKNKKVHFLMP